MRGTLANGKHNFISFFFAAQIETLETIGEYFLISIIWPKRYKNKEKHTFQTQYLSYFFVGRVYFAKGFLQQQKSQCEPRVSVKFKLNTIFVSAFRYQKNWWLRQRYDKVTNPKQPKRFVAGPSSLAARQTVQRIFVYFAHWRVCTSANASAVSTWPTTQSPSLCRSTRNTPAEKSAFPFHFVCAANGYILIVVVGGVVAVSIRYSINEMF